MKKKSDCKIFVKYIYKREEIDKSDFYKYFKKAINQFPHKFGLQISLGIYDDYYCYIDLCRINRYDDKVLTILIKDSVTFRCLKRLQRIVDKHNKKIN